SNQLTSILNRWRKPGDDMPIMRASTDPVVALDMEARDAYYNSDASYIRLKNLSISWMLPAKWLSGAHLQNGNIYLSGQNLITISKYIGLDPESQSSMVLPPLKILTIGFQVGF
ncbi:MAG: SusC/RagA family TonB-linked outer membrane protein, partial [Chitinophagaceae bacterium]|nr:SusC/RagA family TonB-linked outer membrane protein [Chitinophagaceae bacterium]